MPGGVSQAVSRAARWQAFISAYGTIVIAIVDVAIAVFLALTLEPKRVSLARLLSALEAAGARKLAGGEGAGRRGAVAKAGERRGVPVVH